jgi:predicted outer membrane repeat protein
MIHLTTVRSRIALLVACLYPVVVAGQTPTRILYVDGRSTCVHNGNCSTTPCGASWATAFKNLQDAIACTDNLPSPTDPTITIEQIWVARGVYKPVLCVSNNCVCTSTCTSGSSLRANSFNLKKTVEIYGGFAGTETALAQRPLDPDPYTIDPATDSVLSGDLNGNDTGDDPEDISRNENSAHVVLGTGTDRTAILDGFTVTSGSDDAYAYESGGGGIRLDSNSRAIIRNCAILSNRATGGGGGIYCPGDSDPSPIGGSYIVNCVIARNVAMHGGGIGGKGVSSHRIFNCQIVSNKSYSQGGGLFLAEGSGGPLIVNTLIAGNTDASEGGGIYTEGEFINLTLKNCTLANNSAPYGGALRAKNKVNVLVHNCIIWGNTADRGASVEASSFGTSGKVEVRYSDVRRRRACSGGTNNRAPCMSSADCSGSLCSDAEKICLGGTKNDWSCGSSADCPGGGTCVGGDVYDPFLKVDTDTLGAGNLLNTDPLFVDAPSSIIDTSYDLSLRATSPCIDAGSNVLVPPDDADVDENGNLGEKVPLELGKSLRFVNGPVADTGVPDVGYPLVVDIGAYESQECAAAVDCGPCNNSVCSNGICVSMFVDCNNNGINDLCDMVTNPAQYPDCNANLIPDECDVAAGGVSADCNANLIPDECDIATGGGSTDCNANLIPDECDVAAGGASADCNANLIPDECDIAGGGASTDCNANLIPDECERLAADPSGFDKCRFISFVPPAVETGEYAIKVILTSLHHPDPPYTDGDAANFSACEGQTRWVGQPTQFVESVSSGTPFYAAFLCKGAGFCCGGRYDGLACDNVVTFCPEGGHCGPFYSANWGNYGLIHVTGSAIVPSSMYSVQIVPAAGAACVSPLTVRTTRWGDVVTTFQLPTPPVTQPDFIDIGALVDKFRSVIGAPIKASAMLAGMNDANGEINIVPDVSFVHITAVTDAFNGLPYPYSIRNCP